MNNFSKFVGCSKIFCIKSWYDFKVGTIYNCKCSIVDGDYLSVEFKDNISIAFTDHDSDDNFDGKYVKNVLESFLPLSEYRKLKIDNLL